MIAKQTQGYVWLFFLCNAFFNIIFFLLNFRWNSSPLFESYKLGSWTNRKGFGYRWPGSKCQFMGIWKWKVFHGKFFFFFFLFVLRSHLVLKVIYLSKFLLSRIMFITHCFFYKITICDPVKPINFKSSFFCWSVRLLQIWMVAVGGFNFFFVIYLHKNYNKWWTSYKIKKNKKICYKNGSRSHKHFKHL